MFCVSDQPEDINAALYSSIAKAMLPFACAGTNANSVLLFENALFDDDVKASAIDSFVEEIMVADFLKNLQLDCLEIYPRILDAELPLRPALFLDFDKGYAEHPQLECAFSTHNFEQYKDLFKDISEIISKTIYTKLQSTTYKSVAITMPSCL